MITEYKQLKVGDVRKGRDEVKHLYGGGLYGSNWGGYTRTVHNDFDWHPVNLVGHKILPSDLIIAEFRRPLI